MAMDQKNTIIKCAMHKCLFNKRGTCEQYVITLGIDGKCTTYCETELPPEQKTCHEDCIHFDDSDPMIGPVCLFKHPEPLKDFYEGMPCDYYHSTNYTRDQRAKEDQAIMNKIGYVPPKEADQMCWYCDNGKHGKCKFSIRPMKDANGECCRFTSTGGNR